MFSFKIHMNYTGTLFCKLPWGIHMSLPQYNTKNELNFNLSIQRWLLKTRNVNDCSIIAL